MTGPTARGELPGSPATLLDVVRDRAARHGDRVALEELAVSGARADRRLTWGEWHEASRRVAAIRRRLSASAALWRARRARSRAARARV